MENMTAMEKQIAINQLLVLKQTMTKLYNKRISEVLSDYEAISENVTRKNAEQTERAWQKMAQIKRENEANLSILKREIEIQIRELRNA